MDKIINALDYAEREGHKTVRKMYIAWCREMSKKFRLSTPFVDCEPVGKQVKAEVNSGQWVARCECGGAEAVCEKEPIFYCRTCGNYENKGKPRKVKFPKEVQEIEILLLKRPVKQMRGIHYIERLLYAEPLAFDKLGVLTRSWDASETIKDLEKQNEAIK